MDNNARVKLSQTLIANGLAPEKAYALADEILARNHVVERLDAGGAPTLKTREALRRALASIPEYYTALERAREKERILTEFVDGREPTPTLPGAA